MKCPECGGAHGRQSGMVCACGYRFCLDPKTDKIADGKMRAAIRRASAGGTVHYTRNQLYVAFCGLLRSKATIPCMVLSLFPASFLALMTNALLGIEPPFIFLVMGGVYFFTLRLLLNNYHTIWGASFKGFKEVMRKWQNCYPETLDRLIEQPSLGAPPEKWPEPDIYDYGVERILFVDQDILVDLLVLNGFHAQERALVLSTSGYPRYILDKARELIESPQPPGVFLLHGVQDNDNEGMDNLLKAQPWLSGHEIIDLGISKGDAKNIKGLKQLPGKVWDGKMPVDALGTVKMTALLAACLAEGEALTSLVQAAHSLDISGSGDFG